jgi:hypothetical protein
MPIGWLQNDAQNRRASILGVPDGGTIGAAIY